MSLQDSAVGFEAGIRGLEPLLSQGPSADLSYLLWLARRCMEQVGLGFEDSHLVARAKTELVRVAVQVAQCNAH